MKISKNNFIFREYFALEKPYTVQRGIPTELLTKPFCKSY
jgi:hypothetical protein